MKSKILFYDRKALIQTETGYAAYYYGDLMYIVFDKPYCKFHFIDGVVCKIEISLQYLLDNLPAAFTKCKRSTIVNLCYIKNFRTKNPPKIIMVDNVGFKLSKQNVQEFELKISNMPRISPPCPACNDCMDVKCKSQVAFCRRNEFLQKTEPEKE